MDNRSIQLKLRGVKSGNASGVLVTELQATDTYYIKRVNTARRYSQGAEKKAGVKIGNVRATIIAFGIKPVVMKIRYYN